MFIKISLCGALTLLSTTSAFALSCINDYGGSSSCANNTQAAGDCETLGYSKDNVSGCEHYLYCPFDISYKRCVSMPEEVFSACPEGYSDKLLSVSDCGTQGSKGWTFSSTTVEASDGSQVTCGKCSPKTCSGYYEKYKTVSDCGTSGSKGWTFASCYAGDTLMGKCTAKTCASHGYKTSSSVETGQYICKKATAWLGDRQDAYSCYDCAPCNTATKYQGVTDKRYIGDQSSIDICGYDKSSSAKLYGLYKNYFRRPS